MKNSIFAAGLAAAILSAGAATAADKYVLDASPSQIVFSYNHLG
jgi:polyisoprenoid-binding protein YceI